MARFIRRAFYGLGLIWLSIPALLLLFAGTNTVGLRHCLSFVLGLFCVVIARWVKPAIQSNIFVLAVASALPLVIGEAYFSIRTYYPNLLSALLAGKSFDLRSELEVTRAGASGGVTLYPTIDPIYCLTEKKWTADLKPLASLSKARLIDCNESGSYAEFSSDEHGFRNPQGLYRPDLDAVIIGDSLAHGSCVPEGSDISSVLRQRYPGVLNLGHGGNGPLIDLATLTEYVEPLKPKWIFWLHFEGNDLGNLHAERQLPLLQRYLKEASFSQQLMQRQVEIDGLIKTHILDRLSEEARWSSRLDSFLNTSMSFLTLYETRHAVAGLLNPQTNLYAEEREMLRKVFEEALRRSKRFGSGLVMVYLPTFSRFADPNYSNESREYFLDLNGKLGIPVIDVAEGFANSPDPLDLFPFRRPNHYNERGYALVANLLANFLDKQRMQKSQG